MSNSDPYKHADLVKIYGSHFIDRKMEGYYPDEPALKKPSHLNNLIDKGVYFIKKRLSIDNVMKEVSFGVVALATYIFMQYSGRITSLKGFGSLIGITLLVACGYNLFKASLRSLSPGIFCLVGGLVFLHIGLPKTYLSFVTIEQLNYLVGLGGFFMAISLMNYSD